MNPKVKVVLVKVTNLRCFVSVLASFEVVYNHRSGGRVVLLPNEQSALDSALVSLVYIPLKILWVRRISYGTTHEA